MRNDDKVYLLECPTCLKEQRKDLCPHENEARTLTDTYSVPEIEYGKVESKLEFLISI